MFIHEEIPLGYDDLECETSKSGRKYLTPNGVAYPSITTVLGVLGKESLQRWRARVGEEEANKIGAKAARRGTAVHAIIEKYVNNEESFAEGYTPQVIGNFNDVKPILDEQLTKVYAQEVPLYSDYLGVAGRVDCVGEWNGKPAIIDYKTSRKPKRKEWIESYFMQEAFYSIAWEERTGMPITQLVTVIAVDHEPPQVFVEHRDNWDKKLIETIEEYKRQKKFGHI